MYGRGSKHPNWVGDRLTYSGIHTWVHRNGKKPQYCEHCWRETRLEAANISGAYMRDMSDYRYLCHLCHMVFDGIYTPRHITPVQKMSMHKASQTHCIRGHEFTKDNTREVKRVSGTTKRICKACDAERHRLYRREKHGA